LSDKKHRLICYFFESIVQMLLSPLGNILCNPGCESFSLIFDEGYDNNVNIRNTLDLGIETCNLLPVIMDTSSED